MKARMEEEPNAAVEGLILKLVRGYILRLDWTTKGREEADSANNIPNRTGDIAPFMTAEEPSWVGG